MPRMRTACDYVHLNPIRAKLLEASDRLLAYPWSGFPLYLAAPKYRPAWLRPRGQTVENSASENFWYDWKLLRKGKNSVLTV